MSSRAEEFRGKPSPFMDYIRKIHVPNLFGKDSPRPTNNESQTSSTDLIPDQDPDLLILPQEPIDRKKDIERWSNYTRRIDTYDVANPDGTISKKRRLFIGPKDNEEYVMDEFEQPWVDRTVKEMFKGKEGSLRVIERGYGLGLMSRGIIQEMAKRGGEYVLVELNKQVFEDAKTRFKKIMPILQKAQDQGLMPKLEIQLILGDADEAIKSFPDEYFDLVFSDTHQLREDERGVNDLLTIDTVVRKIKKRGRFTFCAFHRDNQTGYPDTRQLDLIGDLFGTNIAVYHERVNPPVDCTYAYEPQKLPVVICEKPEDDF